MDRKVGHLAGGNLILEVPLNHWTQENPRTWTPFGGTNGGALAANQRLQRMISYDLEKICKVSGRNIRSHWNHVFIVFMISDWCLTEIFLSAKVVQKASAVGKVNKSTWHISHWNQWKPYAMESHVNVTHACTKHNSNTHKFAEVGKTKAMFFSQPFIEQGIFKASKTAGAPHTMVHAITA